MSNPNKLDIPFPQSPVVPAMVEGDHKIQFSCHKGISCWNACCSNIDISLTPLDIIRLKQRLGISSTDFLREYTVPYEMEKDGMAGVKLRSIDGGSACRFMKPEGCGVYEDRPTACRYYPVALLSMRRSDEYIDRQSYAIVKEAHCKGHEVARTLTVDAYRSEQGLTDYDELTRGWRQLILKKKSSGPTIGAPSLKSRQLFFMACYDIDTFHSFVESEAFGKLFKLADDEKAMLLADDVELMQFSFRFLRQVLFGEQSIALDEAAAKERFEKWKARQMEIEREAAEKRAKLDDEMAKEGFNEEDSGLGYCADEGGSCAKD
jgi:Fe-S-cluster containining protein